MTFSLCWTPPSRWSLDPGTCTCLKAKVSDVRKIIDSWPSHYTTIPGILLVMISFYPILTIIEWLNPNFCVFQSHFLMVSLLSAGDIGIIDPIVKCHSLPWKFMNTHQQIQMNSVKLSHPIQSHEKSPFKSQPPLNPIEIPLKSPWNHFISSPWNPMKSHEIPWNPMKSHEIPMKSHQNPANPNLQTQPPGFHPEGPRPRGGDPLDTAESAARASCRDAHGEVRWCGKNGGMMVEEWWF